MHSLLTAFYALIFAFGHADSVRHAATVTASAHTSYFAAIAPRSELGVAEVRNASYAGSSCSYCRKTNATYTVR